MKFITYRPLWVNVLAGIILVVGIILLFAASLKWITQHGKAMKVPSVTGKNFNDARNLLEDMGFDVVVQDSIYRDTAAPLAVIRQIPDADATVKVNRTVYLTINRALPPMVEMPNLIGYSYRNAEMILKHMGLKIGDTTFKPDFAKNSILQQSYDGSPILPGTKLQMGSSVSLVLGDGVGNISLIVPSLVGMTYDQARRLLQSNGLNVGAIVIDPTVADTANAYIYKQNPERFNEDGIKQKIRPGQLMDVWLSAEKPILDSANAPVELEF